MKLTIKPNEIIPFDMYFASIVGMNLHPGTTRDPPSKRTIEECFNLAVQMVYMRRERLLIEGEENYVV